MIARQEQRKLRLLASSSSLARQAHLVVFRQPTCRCDSLASDNVYAMPPPMSIASATFIRFSTTSILSDTFAPPRIRRMAAQGFVSACRDRPAPFPSADRRPACLTKCVIRHRGVRAGAEPNASQTNSPSQSEQACAKNSWSLASSSAWKRTFSSSSSLRSSRFARGFDRVTTNRDVNSICAEQFASWPPRAQAIFGFGLPFGRPRCERAPILAPRSIGQT